MARLCARESTVKIVEIRAIPLMGRATDGGWHNRIAASESVQTLVEVITDEGVTGFGSASTSQTLVEGALRLLRPWCVGDSAIEPQRLSEQLHQQSFWQGRGGAVTHTISGIDMALWDIL